MSSDTPFVIRRHAAKNFVDDRHARLDFRRVIVGMIIPRDDHLRRTNRIYINIYILYCIRERARSIDDRVIRRGNDLLHRVGPFRTRNFIHANESLDDIPFKRLLADPSDGYKRDAFFAN